MTLVFYSDLQRSKCCPRFCFYVHLTFHFEVFLHSNYKQSNKNHKLHQKYFLQSYFAGPTTSSVCCEKLTAFSCKPSLVHLKRFDNFIKQEQRRKKEVSPITLTGDNNKWREIRNCRKPLSHAVSMPSRIHGEPIHSYEFLQPKFLINTIQLKEISITVSLIKLLQTYRNGIH